MEKRLGLLSSLLIFIVMPSAFSASESKASAEVLVDLVDLVEEGWRYEKSLKLKIVDGDMSQKVFDFQRLHEAMALTVHIASSQLACDFDTTRGDKVLSIFRFTPLIRTSTGIHIGTPLSLSSTMFEDKPIPPLVSALIPTQETIFVSGFYDVESKGPLAKFINTKNAELLPTARKADKMFVMLPPFNPDKPHGAGLASKYDLAIRFIQRNYVDPSLFEERIIFRYPDDPSGTIFSRGNYDPINQAHKKAKELIAARKAIIAADFAKYQEAALEGDVIEALKGFEELKRGRHKFHDVAEAGSYTCAEQTALDYLTDKKVLEHIQHALELDSAEVIGLIIHVHCSHTPCSSCATALARECEPEGLFSRLTNGKPIKIVASCSNHYPRPGAMVPYKDTTWLKNIRREEGNTLFLAPEAIATHHNLPYPVALLKFDPPSFSFKIDFEHYDMFES